ncbi:LVIVD repeat-containing protein [Myxococcus sp. Y35]|uniref:LVIVD repeat-containing protein n=1 Tax=Pseudomyxococcus flavus TaxID=3115648 RepID=UPI003CFAECF0
MFRRAVRPLLALACAASLSACSSSEPAPPAPPPEPPAYDGPWAVVPEQGEWVDPGPFETCPTLSAQAACGAPETFVVPGCDMGSLATLERQGAIYRAEIRYELPSSGGGTRSAPGSGGFQFDAAGQPLSVMGRTPNASSVEGERFVLSTEYTRTSNETDRLTFAACRAQGPRSLSGCFTWCRNGALHYLGSFRAERMTWREDEPESSALELLSESFVERGTPVDVYVTRGHAYVVSINAPQGEGGLTVFDVREPRAPVQTASFQLPSDGYWNGVWAKDNALYVASGDAGLLVFDLENPARPTFVRNHPGNAGPINVHTVFVEGARLYAMSPSPSQETLIFDIANPLEPRLLTRYAYPGGTGYPHDAFAYGGRLYVNHTTDGFLIVGLDGETPSLLGRYGYAHAFSHANAVGTFSGRTVAFEGGETLGAHVRVLDVTNPTGIAKIGEYRLRGLTSIHNMVLVGTRLYVAWYHEGVRVLDVSNPAQPREVAHFNTFRETDPRRTDGMYEGAIGMRVPGDGHVYVVDTSRGLLIFDEP